MTTATTTIDPRLISMLGRKLYSSNPMEIVVRELLQNAVDACKRKGVEPDITICIRELDSSTDWLVSCQDNGIGMTESQLVNDFLCLGGKKSSNGGQTGGFGIAKAAIMSCADWHVRTLDNYLSSRILLEGSGLVTDDTYTAEDGDDSYVGTKPAAPGEIRKTFSRKSGTTVSVRIREHVWGSQLRTAMLFIFLSEVNVHLIVHMKSWPFLRYNGRAGLLGIPMKLKSLEEGEWMNAHGIHEVTLPKIGDSFEWAILGRSYVRLNGLVQFQYGNQNSARQTCLIFDVKTSATPEDPLYPFSMSRESLTESYTKLIDSILLAHNANVLESVLTVVRETPPDEERIDVIKGKKLSGSRRTRYSRRPGEGRMGNVTQAGKTVLNTVNSPAHRNGNDRVQLLIRRYKRDPEKKSWHAKVLLAWQDVLQLVAEDAEDFGIGITSEGMIASRLVLDGDIYYIIDPDLAVPEKLLEQGSEAIVLGLWALATHEATHCYVDDHNEWFTTTLASIQQDSSIAILSNLRKIAKRLQ